jgi:DNA replication licensing factor MCM2
VPIAVRHIESIVRIAEANAKMHLRDHVRNEDVDMAIRVMVESFIAAQKYSVQTTLRRKFRKYIVYKKHNNSLIMHVLQQMVRDQMTFEQMRQGARGNGLDIERVEIREDDLLIRMRELDIHDISTFLKSREFFTHGFIYDRERKTIIRNV